MTSRPAEIEQWSNARLIHPLSRRCARGFIALGLSANSVSLLGLGLIFAAAVIFALRQGPAWMVAGSVLLFASHVMDGADGIVARTTGTSSRFGEIIDGVCDYLGYGALYVALGYLLSARHGPGLAVALVLITTLSHVAQANLYETRRRQYCYRVHGTAWIGSSGQVPSEAPRILQALARLFLVISTAISGENRDVVRTLAADPARRPAFQAMRQRHLKLMAPLSQNVKSLAFATAMIAGVPDLYVFLVVVMLNAWMLLVRVIEARDERHFPAFS